MGRHNQTGKGKRKKRSSGSGSGSNSDTDKRKKRNKQSKPGQSLTDLNDSTIVLSDILNETNSVLYDSEISSIVAENLDDSVFKDSASNMAGNGHSSTGNSSKNTVMSENDQLAYLVSTVKAIKQGQDDMKTMFEAKFDNLKSELTSTINNKVESLKTALSADIVKETRRIDDVLSRLDTLEQQRSALHASDHRNSDILNDHTVNPANPGNPLSDPNRSLTASGIQVTPSENLIHKAQELVDSMGAEVINKVMVTDAIRLTAKFDDRPPILKFSVQSLEEKIRVLRNKPNLRFIAQYKNTQVRSSKSRIERILEMNARAVLRNLPHGRSLRVDASGRIKQRVQQHRELENMDQGHGARQQNDENAD